MEAIKEAVEALKHVSDVVKAELAQQADFLHVGDKVIVQGLVKKSELNGATAVVEDLDLDRGRFVLLLEDGTRVNVKEDNIRPQSEEKEALRAAKRAADARLSPLQRAYKILEEGAFFSGTINIPGISQGAEMNEYTLEVINKGYPELRLPEDAGGVPALFGIHIAFGDEQVCDLRLRQRDEDGAIELSFADRETSCKGIMNLEELTIEGTVSQLLSSGNGFTYPSDEVTHRFHLRLVDKASHHMARVFRARSRATLQRVLFAVVAFAEASAPAVPYKDLAFLTNDRMHLELLDQARFLCEESCAILRYWSSHLSGLKFETPEDKAAKLGVLAETYELTRNSGHKITDRGLSCLHQLLLMVSVVGPHSVLMVRVAQQMKELERIQSSFSLFESALNAAGARIPLASQTEWRHSLAGEKCMICLCETEAEEESLVLPCGHCFHEPCAERWLHTNATCPCCRRVLTGEEGRTNPADINTSVPEAPAQLSEEGATKK